MQNLGEKSLPFLVTLNPDHTPKHTLLKWSTSHPIPSVAASKATVELPHIQGKRGIWFCGAYQGEVHLSELFHVCIKFGLALTQQSYSFPGYGFHEDGLKVCRNSVVIYCCIAYSNFKVQFNGEGSILQAGMAVAHSILGNSCALLSNPKHMVPSLTETGARLFVTRFIRHYISTGCLM